MEIGALFILVLVVIVLGVVGFALYLVAMRLRHQKLHPDEDQLEARRTEDEQRSRPEHLRVSSEGPSRPVTHRE